MKKLLSFVLSLILLLSLSVLPAEAAAEKNYCELFETAIKRMHFYAPDDGVAEGDNFPISTVMNYTRSWVCTDEYGEMLVTEGDYSYYGMHVVPADVFEAAAGDFFHVIDVQAMRAYTGWFWDYETESDIENFQFYRPDRNVYQFSTYGGMGDSSTYQVLGYTEKDGLYTVYSRFVGMIYEGEPTGVEGEDYFFDGEYYWEIFGYRKNVVSIHNGRVQFHTWEMIDSVPDVEMVKPITVVAKTETVRIEAESDVFPADTVVEIVNPVGELLKTVTNTLTDIASDFVAYDINATAQPDGVVRVTFNIPSGYDANKVGVFYISSDGVAQQLKATVDIQAGTITAELTHFSLYAVAQLNKSEAEATPNQTGTTPESAKPTMTSQVENTHSPQKDTSKSFGGWVLLLCIVLAVVLCGAFLLYKRKKK